MRLPLFRPPPPSLCPRPQAPWSRRRRLQASSQGQLQTASWVPRRRGPAPPLPPLPAGLSLCQPRSYKLSLTHIPAPPRALTLGLLDAHPQGAHTRAACMQGGGGGREEGRNRRATHAQTAWARGRGGEAREPAAAEGGGARAGKRDREETLGGQRMGWRGLTGCSRGGNSTSSWHRERGVLWLGPVEHESIA